MTPIDMLALALKSAPHQREAIAARIGVSISSLDRWVARSAVPTETHRAKLLEVLGELNARTPASEAKQLIDALPAVREVMHSRGVTSSRNDAIDQISALILFQILHARKFTSHPQKIIDRHNFQFALTYLPSVIKKTFSEHVSNSLNSTLSFFRDEISFTFSLLDILKPVLNEIASRTTGTSDHLWHELFVGFLSSSFHEEKEFAQYMTPIEVVDFMVQAAALFLPKHQKTVKVLDPSCGTGTFLTKCSDLISDRKLTICGVDTNERMARLAAISAVASDLDPKCIRLGNSLNADLDADFLNPGFVDLILTNPPFGAEHSKGSHGSKKVPSELAYLPRYLEWLKPEGVCAVILPDSVLTNRGAFSNARRDLANGADILAVISLPAMTFAASGTTTKTSIVILQKSSPTRTAQKTFLATVSNVGFKVVNRGSVRRRVPSLQSDFPSLISALRGTDNAFAGIIETQLPRDGERWDAPYWISSLPRHDQDAYAQELTPLCELADLVNEKVNPKVLDAQTFFYIEISGVAGDLLRVSATETPTAGAPSRARRKVKAGDVLLSTVRPERRTVGVVPAHLDGAICSTGFAVIRPKSISPYVLASMLRSEIVTSQLNGIASGVAYPAFDAAAVDKISVPFVDERRVQKLISYGRTLEALEVARLALEMS
ncbi:N-6 DNA methylase [Citromicrobium sp. JLT1363]|uniref:N-6 DNA methylase n=1 Tax=Citromicrobium sp. JLT1363 TaxID=517722 RepID=UPI0002EC5E4F|nr:N-6 DNA methylase [Citromicrobium sp. JLT1363]